MEEKDLNLQEFFPENLKVQKIVTNEDTVYIHLRSTARQLSCPDCGKVMRKRHTLHHRTVQDLPIFGKRTYLKITVCDFECTNPDCACISKAETFDGFLGARYQMTERLADLAVQLALETSCEGAARILNGMHVKICGDTVIHILLRRYEKLSAPKSGDCIGVDDFAFKKGQTYGTIVVDGKTHVPLAILEGRDGSSLKEWLARNRHVTMVTRDRASAYAKAVEEILPDAMQVADRFHLYQNLMKAVKKVIKQEVRTGTPVEMDSKKNAV